MEENTKHISINKAVTELEITSGWLDVPALCQHLWSLCPVELLEELSSVECALAQQQQCSLRTGSVYLLIDHPLTCFPTFLSYYWITPLFLPLLFNKLCPKLTSQTHNNFACILVNDSGKVIFFILYLPSTQSGLCTHQKI